MRATLMKSPLFATVVIAGLAAGTVLLAGYVDKPSQGTAVTADSRCNDCPKAGKEAGCQVGGACEIDGACANPCDQGTCASQCTVSCCENKAECASCCGTDCAGRMQSSCGAGGCAHTQ